MGCESHSDQCFHTSNLMLTMCLERIISWVVEMSYVCVKEDINVTAEPLPHVKPELI